MILTIAIFFLYPSTSWASKSKERGPNMTINPYIISAKTIETMPNKIVVRTLKII